jgi:MSHA biogenesis protein MshN
MSIINQMLQKLEQRRGGRDASLPEGVRAVAASAEKSSRRPLLLGVAVLVLAAGGYYGWMWQQQTKAVKSVAVAGKMPGAQPQSPPSAAPAKAAEKPEEEKLPLVAGLEVELEGPAQPSAKPVRKKKRLPSVEAPGEASVTQADDSPAGMTSKSPSRESAGKIRVREGELAVKSVTPQQQALYSYQKALSWLQQGRIAEARSALEESLRLDPYHLAARQALAGLLVELRQLTQAEVILQEGLGMNAEQYGFAMALARLQVERGDTRSALDTLHRSLPHASANAGYQAFLAAILQSSGQHKGAIEHYQAALRLAPSGTWQMGLGISLQSENRLSEAQEAFRLAKASNELSPDLLTFVEQRLRMVKKLQSQQTSQSPVSAP